MVQAAVPHMPEGGRVIFFSTGTTTHSGIAPDYPAYSATKRAVEQLSRILSKELGAKGITVNTLSPGPIAMQMFLKDKTQEMVTGSISNGPRGRLGDPKEIAAAVAYLASPGAKWVSGIVLRGHGRDDRLSVDSCRPC